MDSGQLTFSCSHVTSHLLHSRPAIYHTRKEKGEKNTNHPALAETFHIKSNYVILVLFSTHVKNI